jgi:hypothetical protein
MSSIDQVDNRSLPAQILLADTEVVTENKLIVEKGSNFEIF